MGRRSWDDKGSPESQRVGALAIFVLLFVVVWVLGFAMAMAGGGCLQEDRASERRLRLCDLSVGLAHVIPHDRDELAYIYQERGMLRAVLGRPDDAATDFDRAIDLATNGAGWSVAQEHSRPHQEYWRNLDSRIAEEPEGSVARQLWGEAVARSDRPERG